MDPGGRGARSLGKTVVCYKEVRHLEVFRIHHLTPVVRPYLHLYAHSNEIEEVGIITLSGVNVESDPNKTALIGVGARLLSWMGG